MKSGDLRARAPGKVPLPCVMPGEFPHVFGDALRRLAGAATYLYQDGPRAWYATQPTGFADGPQSRTSSAPTRTRPSR